MTSEETFPDVVMPKCEIHKVQFPTSELGKSKILPAQPYGWHQIKRTTSLERASLLMAGCVCIRASRKTVRRRVRVYYSTS